MRTGPLTTSKGCPSSRPVRCKTQTSTALTIAEAVDSGLPTVIVMASPAFCTNAVCGPQVEVLQELKDEFEGKANFVHVDYYDNPEEIQGDLTRAVVSPVAKQWGLPSTEWSFVIDRDGIVSGRFEGLHRVWKSSDRH